MRKPLMSRLGLLPVIALTLTGCASRSVQTVECPSFVPSQQALTPIQGTGWKPLAGRVIETYSRPSSEH